MAVPAVPGSSALGSADAAEIAILRGHKESAIRAFRAQNHIHAYTSPRALRRFLGCQLPELSYNTCCPNHEMILVSPQTYKNKHSCFVSIVCVQCRYHFHVKNDMKYSRPFDKEHPRHMLIPCDQKNKDLLRSERHGYNDIIGYARFICAADDCCFNIEISTMPPKISNGEVNMLVDNDRVFRNLQQARREDPERYADVGDDYGAAPAGTFMRYLTDALERPTGGGPLKIKKRNKRFMVSFSTDFDPLLRLLGFQERNDEADEPCWYITEPEEAQNPTPIRTLRARMQDTQEELKTLIPGVKTVPAWENLINVFQGAYDNVENVPGLKDIYISENDLELLGCLIDYPPAWFSRAAIILSGLNPRRRDEYLDAALRCIQQRDSDALLHVTMYRSQFDSTASDDARVQEAFKFFGSSSVAGMTTDWFVSKYIVITQANPSDSVKALAQQHLEVISNYFGKDLISEIDKGGHDPLVAQALISSSEPQASNRRMSIGSATRLLNVDADYPAEMIRDFVANVDEKEDRGKVVEALEVLIDLKRQQNLPDDATNLQETVDFLKATSNTGKVDLAKLSNDNQDQPIRATGASLNTPPGLKNIGNTCYLNSLLQYFYNVKVVRDLVLNADQYCLELNEETVKARRTGGNGTSVNLEEAIVARQFIEMLRGLFLELQTTTDVAAQPSQKLANTALSSAKDILTEKPQNQPPPLPARPSPAPPVPPKEDVDMVNVTVEPVSDQLETASSRSSQTLVNEGEDTRMDSYVQINHGDDREDKIKISDGPLPPTPEKDTTATVEHDGDIKMDELPGTATLEEKFAQVSRRLEQSDRSGTSQQDVEEIIGNILEHLMRAIRSDGPIRGKPDLQADKITETFFTIIVNCTVKTSVDETTGTTVSPLEENVLNEEIVPERWITAFPHPDKDNKVKSTLYEALDRYFSYELLSDGSLARYTTIRELPPILHICIQRSDASGVKNKNPVVIPETLYLDRYLETEAGTPLWHIRRRVWSLKERLKNLESRRAINSQETAKKPEADGWSTPEWDDALNIELPAYGDLFTLNETMTKDIVRPNKRNNSEASLGDPSELVPSKKQSLSPDSSDTGTKLVNILGDYHKPLDEMDSSELLNLRKEEHDAFDNMQEEKYSLHAIICHGGGMNAGHYWVWIRDFNKQVWYKYNDSLVTEDSRDSQLVLDELNNSGDPYYVAYVRDDRKNDLVEVPQRHKQGNEVTSVANDQDVEMQTIEGVAPDSNHQQQPPSTPTDIAGDQSMSTISEKARDEDLPAYEML
ncbi:hypothetical protein F4809DRAFT_409250 [Biscogniauxia mediterranea]|nr:hypothetical protein F4809DRAFT_409250 [Biscogniauxia mediterranea]